MSTFSVDARCYAGANGEQTGNKDLKDLHASPNEVVGLAERCRRDAFAVGLDGRVGQEARSFRERAHGRRKR